MLRMRKLVGALAIPPLLLCGLPARAEPGFLLATASETSDSRSDAQMLLLDLGPGTSFDFELADKARVAIFFTATCLVSSNDATTFLDVDLLVDGFAAPPTDFVEPFCSSPNESGSVSRDAVVTLLPGAHTLEVAAQLFGFDPGESWTVGHKSLILVVQVTP